MAAGITGSIVSATVLKSEPPNITDEDLQYCGAKDCPGRNKTSAEEPVDDKTVCTTL